MERNVIAGSLNKYSMGRSVGIHPQNWKTRLFKLTTLHLTTFASTEDSEVKFECPLTAVSILYCNPTKADHSQATGNDAPLMFALRLFDNGAYTLLMQAQNREEKERWVQALKDTIGAKSKGFQVVE